MAYSTWLPFYTCWSSAGEKKPRSCKLAVVGDKSSGKTSLIYRFSRDRMPQSRVEMTSVLETDEMDVFRNGKMYHVTVHDTSGDEEYVKVRALTYSQVDAVIICVSLDTPESLSRLESEWAPEIRHLCKKKPFLIVGTKKDLRDNVKSRTTQTKQGFIT